MIFAFIIFKRLGDFIRSVYYVDILINQAMAKRDEMEALLRDLNAYRSSNKGTNLEKKPLIMHTNFLGEDK